MPRVMVASVGTLLVIAAVAITALAVGDNADAYGAASSAPAVSPAAISARTIRQGEAIGVEIQPAPSSRSATSLALTSDSAVSRSRAEFWSLVQDAVPAEVGLVSLTTPRLGKELHPDPAAPSKIAPLAVDRLVWAVYYPDVEIPVLGVDPDQRATSYDAPFIVFLDAATGAFVSAESL